MLGVDIVVIDPAESDPDIGLGIVLGVGDQGRHLGYVGSDVNGCNLIVVKDLGVRWPGSEVGVRDRGEGPFRGGTLKELVIRMSRSDVVELTDKGLSLDGSTGSIKLDVGVLDRGCGSGDDTREDGEGVFGGSELCDLTID